MGHAEQIIPINFLFLRIYSLALEMTTTSDRILQNIKGKGLKAVVIRSQSLEEFI